MTIVHATYDDFIKSLDNDEASELSALNLPDDPMIYRQKITYQLGLAANEWLSWFSIANPYPIDQVIPPECSGSCIKCEIAIARYAMDYNNPREDVVVRWEKCREIARDWQKDQLNKAKLPGGELPGEEFGMSIFTI